MKKPTNPALNLSNSEVESLLARMSELTMAKDQLEADQEESRRRLDADLLPIKEAYRPSQEKRAASIETLCVKIDECRTILEAWATAHKAEHFTTARRSLALTHAVIGFRLSKPRIMERPRRTFARAAYWLSRLTWGRKYLRPATLNKEAILKDRAAFGARPERLRKIGVAIVQDDVFYVDLHETRSDLTTDAQHKEAT